MGADLDTVKIGLEVLSLVATGVVAWFGMKVRNVVLSIRLEQMAVKEELSRGQQKLKEELIAQQVKVKEELTNHIFQTKQELAVHTGQDEVRFKTIDTTLARIDANTQHILTIKSAQARSHQS
jgi:hypothetical protein